MYDMFLVEYSLKICTAWSCDRLCLPIRQMIVFAQVNIRNWCKVFVCRIHFGSQASYIVSKNRNFPNSKRIEQPLFFSQKSYIKLNARQS